MALSRLQHLDASKLRENALTSIRLGIEDFEVSQRAVQSNGDPARALSAVRNLFAGILLLFKYKIAISVTDPDIAPSLIFNPPEILPYTDGNGGIEWRPVGKFKATTINVETIKQRFEGFGIQTDWKIIDKLQQCRNHLEHLHPANTLGEVADFVAELFPVLRDFILTQMNESPADLLESSWQSMLKHHQFFLDTRTACDAGWSGVDVPEKLIPWLKNCQCPECSSSLLMPSTSCVQKGLSVRCNEDDFDYTCLACGDFALVVPLLMDTLDSAFYYDPTSGDDSSFEECDECGHGTFFLHEQSCLWCSSKLHYRACVLCGEGLGQDDQDNGGLCSYHAHRRDKVMRE